MTKIKQQNNMLEIECDEETASITVSERLPGADSWIYCSIDISLADLAAALKKEGFKETGSSVRQTEGSTEER